MTENVEELADCDTLQEPQRRPAESKLPSRVVCPPGITLEASQQEIELLPAARHAEPELTEPLVLLRSASTPPASSSDCDIIIGGRAIANWLGLTYEQIRPLIDDKTIPTFKLPGHTKRCALKSTLNETFRQYANRHSNRLPIANAPAEEKTCVMA